MKTWKGQEFAAWAACMVCAAGVLGAAAAEIRYAAELNHVVQDAMVTAMGDAGTALPLTPASVFWNPAAPAFLRSFQFSAEYGDLYGGLSHTGCFVFKTPIQDQMSFAALYVPFYSGDHEFHHALPQSFAEMQENGTWPDGEPEGTFGNNQHLAGLTVARLFPLPVPRPGGFNTPFPVDAGAGCTFKWHWQIINPEGIRKMGMNVNLDIGGILRIGAQYDIARREVIREILLGAAIKDAVPSRMMWMYTEEPYQEIVDMSSYFGIAYIDKTGLLWVDWTISAAIKKSYEQTYHGGLEITAFDIVSVRAGMSGRTPTLGAGIAYKRLSFNYAIRFEEIAISPVRLSLGIVF
jgi:hypothetical protein